MSVQSIQCNSYWKCIIIIIVTIRRLSSQLLQQLHLAKQFCFDSLPACVGQTDRRTEEGKTLATA